MKLSTRTRYGTRALMELALRHGKTPVLLKDVARSQGISLPYLEQLIAPLVEGGIVHSARGPRGGISLAREPEDINLAEVTRLLEGTVAPVACVDDPSSCEKSADCPTREVWGRVKEAMDGVLGTTTLQDLVNRRENKGK